MNNAPKTKEEKEAKREEYFLLGLLPDYVYESEKLTNTLK